MRPFRSATSRPAENKFRPNLESLDGRIVPALLNPIGPGGRWVDSLGSLRIDTNSANDRFTVTDTGGTGTGNVSVRAALGSPADPRLQALNDELAVRHVNSLTWFDGGGTNAIAVNAGNIPVFTNGDPTGAPITAVSPSLASVVYIGAQSGPATGEDRFTVNLTGLAANKTLNVSAAGGVGNDTLLVNAGGRYLGGSNLSVSMVGQLGADRVGVNAWNPGATMERGSNMRVSLSGNTVGTIDDAADAGNDVFYWHLGRMDGNIQFDLAGSGGRDQVSANLWLNAESTGSVGNGTATGARVRGGAGNDTLQYIVRGNTRPAPGVGVRYNNLTMDGGTNDVGGQDTALFALTPPPSALVTTTGANGLESVERKLFEAIG